jgi:hypothetical protein
MAVRLGNQNKLAWTWSVDMVEQKLHEIADRGWHAAGVTFLDGQDGSGHLFIAKHNLLRNNSDVALGAAQNLSFGARCTLLRICDDVVVDDRQAT